ncbi:MAG: leucine--tRNA ligase [Candidatus Portnoybacteria bacterium]|nr:leucine--tRNA ligase [Candidatus Portnoybacteria bacterium]
MFPYPSGDGLHTGHVESYTATDIISRYWRMKGKNVLHPQGFDAFGLPAENFAIKTKIHPSQTTQKAIATFKQQMNMLGFSYDWSREVNSSDPKYYKWTQWFFLLLYKNGLAYRGKAKVNWCNSCQTVLANEQAEGGVCERCGSPVVQKDLEQWFFKITDLIESKGATSGLLQGLDKIDWPESTKAGQRNWIGKSEGAQFKMEIITSTTPASGHPSSAEEGTKGEVLDYIEVFTTRLDTVFGMTFALIAPEHKIINELKSQIENWSEVEKYIEEARKKSELQRISETKEKTGVEIKGVKVINPFTEQEIPVFISDFVLAHYGTGAVMAVPGHDQRDYEFAKKFNLPIIEVIKSEDRKSSIEKEAFIEDGVLANSREYDNTTSAKAREKLIEWIQKNNLGEKKINYKMRDWLVSRQRYWGAPIPIIYCPQCCHSRPASQYGANLENEKSGSRIKSGMTEFEITEIDGKKYAMVPIPEKDLPVLLPDDVDFMPHGESPLSKSKKFHDVSCPKCGEKAKRESDTMDTFVCSSWYHFRYADPKNEKEFASKEKIEKWLPVDLYVGGAEHTVLHLLYSRFFTKALHNLGYIDFDEPFLKMRHQGIILAEDGQKMSKSLGNVINPDSVVAQYGADALRMFEMFMGPLEDAKPWNTKGITGIYRFLEKAWRISLKFKVKSEKSGLEVKSLIHKTIKKVSEDIEKLKFNTAISALMVLLNEIEKNEEMPIEVFEKFLILLSPFAPHISEEIWSQLGHEESIFKEKWPEYNPELIKEEIIELIIQINGKVRDTISVAVDISETDAKKLALESEKIKKYLLGREPKKIIFVKEKLINIVL